MEKSTLKALIVAGATVLGGVAQAWISIRSKKRKREGSAVDERPTEGGPNRGD